MPGISVRGAHLLDKHQRGELAIDEAYELQEIFLENLRDDSATPVVAVVSGIMVVALAAFVVHEQGLEKS